MRMTVLSLFDQVAKVFGRPLFTQGRGVALRSFIDEVNNEASGELHKHPEDFALYVLGSFDDEFASFDLLVQPELLAKGLDCVRGGERAEALGAVIKPWLLKPEEGSHV